MSSAWGLIRFKRTGNVYWGSYNGTSDIMLPTICTSEECYDAKLDCYCSITYCRDILKKEDWIFPDSVDDLDEVEIYVDYGSGECWEGLGSESLKRLKGPLNPYEDGVAMSYGEPAWVSDILKKISGE